MRKKVIIKIFQSSNKVYLMFHIRKRFKDVNGNLFPTEFNKNKKIHFNLLHKKVSDALILPENFKKVYFEFLYSELSTECTLMVLFYLLYLQIKKDRYLYFTSFQVFPKLLRSRFTVSYPS